MAHGLTWTGDCPRCGTKRVTFDIRGSASVPETSYRYPRFECFSVCRTCRLSSTHILEATSQNQSALQEFTESVDGIYGWVKLVVVTASPKPCPDHTPEALKTTFDEAARCLSFGCYEAAGTMFRKVLDQATRQMLPAQPEDEDKEHPNYIAWKIRKDLRLRLDWLIERGLLPSQLVPIVDSVREDGNDAAHDRIGVEEARDLEDFTTVLLEVLFTLPGQIEANRVRREERRNLAQ